MLSQSTLIDRFANGAERGSASHMFIEGDVIYSYGHHFALAIRQDRSVSRSLISTAILNASNAMLNQH